jgi:NAD-dependent dihydropyrimidine dehydrogenase PreA subunit
MTYIIAEPCIDIKDRSCVDVCPVDCIHEFERILIIDPEECIDCGACEPECPVEAIFPEDALPDKWEAFVPINYAFPDADKINALTDEYATEHEVQNPPLEAREPDAHYAPGGEGRSFGLIAPPVHPS